MAGNPAKRMRKMHLWVGALTILIFVATGQVMRWHDPPLAEFDAAARLMFRSRHIYILTAGLVNLMLGLYAQAWPSGWRRIVQWAGSALLLPAPALLVLAFFTEPRRGFQPEMWASAAGLYALAGGCALHALAAIGRSNR